MSNQIRRNGGGKHGRGWRMGEHHGKAKLSDSQVAEIRAMHRPGVRGFGYKAIAKRFGTSPWTIRDICTYRTRPL